MWMTIDEAASYLKVSKETLYKMAQREQIPASKLGSQWRFNAKLIDEWLASQSRCQVATSHARSKADEENGV